MAYAHPIFISHLVADPRFAMGIAIPQSGNPQYVAMPQLVAMPQSDAQSQSVTLPSRGHWTEHEDRTLTEAVQRTGTGNWNAIAAVVGRNQKRCRERWHNHLDKSKIRKGDWTEEEDCIIDEAVARMGHKWMEIAKLLPPGRSGESVKNRYKRARNAPRATSSGDSITIEEAALLPGSETGGEVRADAFQCRSAAGASAALLAAAHDWRRKLRVVVLTSADGHPDGWTPTEEMRSLLGAIEELGTTRVDHVDWEELDAGSIADAAAVLPLMAWSMSVSDEHCERFVQLLRRMSAAGARPEADLRVLSWAAHKRYLLELGAAGVPVVPTVLVSAGASEAGLVAARNELDVICPRFVKTARRTCVVKPAVGGGGDGVELLLDGDVGAPALAHLASVLERREMLVQPFLPRVQTEGELAFVFVNEALLHAVRKLPEGWGGQEHEHEQEHTAEEGRASEPRLHASQAQPVQKLTSPPLAALTTARRALAEARRLAGLADNAPPLFLARVDLLPAAGEDAAEPSDVPVASEWLVSELEIGWPHLFLRADETGHEAAAEVARGLCRHLDLRADG